MDKTSVDSGCDWVELYNDGSSSVSLSGCTVSDGKNSYTIPSGVSIGAKGFYVLYLSGAKGVRDGHLHVPFQLAMRGNETFSISGNDVSASLKVPFVPYGWSYGRASNGSSWGYFNPTTKGKSVVVSIRPSEEPVYGDGWKSKVTHWFDANKADTLVKYDYKKDGKYPAGKRYEYRGLYDVIVGWTDAVKGPKEDAFLYNRDAMNGCDPEYLPYVVTNGLNGLSYVSFGVNRGTIEDDADHGTGKDQEAVWRHRRHACLLARHSQDQGRHHHDRQGRDAFN